MLGAQVKDGDVAGDGERGVGVVFGFELVAVERVVAADAGGDAAGADEFSGGGVFQDEEVNLAAGFFDARVEGAE